jgi:glyoxylase-like metal-dependent hydrolase (beta-lactamase superfamily II)
MRQLHRTDLWSWSVFDQARNLDFNSVAWIREGGNVLVDPLPLSEHDLAQLEALGGAAWIVITNSDHTRAAAELALRFGAALAGPAGERGQLPFACARWLSDGDELVPGLCVIELHGSKTPGELALVLERTTLITGDLVRGHALGRLNLLPDPKLGDRAAALASVRRLAALEQIEAVLVGDGWPIARDGHARLNELLG